MDKILVKPQSLRLDLPSEGFQLQSGETLKEIDIAYEIYGELNAARTNVIYVLHALTGDAHAAFYHSEDDAKPGWWDILIGPGKALDTNRFCVICTNLVGGCKGSTGPGSTNPDTGRPYGSAFPLISVRDTVRIERLFFDQLDIPELYGVIGGSLGGMRALEWTIAYPDFVKRCLCIASAAHLTPQALAWDIIGRRQIETDPNWHDGNYYDASEGPTRGLATARQIGHVTYLSAKSMETKFGREERDTPVSDDRSKFSTDFQVESYLTYQGESFVRRFDANSYLYISRMMDMYDLEAEHGSLRAALRHTKAQFLVVSITSDWLFPPEQQQELVSALIAERKRVSFFWIDSSYGHDAFLIDGPELTRGIAAFLDGGSPEPRTETVNRKDFERIRDMLPVGSHALDIGSGGGSLMLALQQAKGVTGICVDRDFDKVVQCMSKGLSALQLDADTSLGLIPTDAFDVVLLNQTIQQLHSALHTMKQMLRIAPTAVIGFPNFANVRYRSYLFFRGRLPKSRDLPYEWYDTPNIHVVTLNDFKALCEKHGVRIDRIEHLADGWLSRMLISFGFRNLGTERGLVRVARSWEGAFVEEDESREPVRDFTPQTE
jgi:homoserine O-acetyltransferase